MPSSSNSSASYSFGQLGIVFASLILRIGIILLIGIGIHVLTNTILDFKISSCSESTPESIKNCEKDLHRKTLYEAVGSFITVIVGTAVFILILSSVGIQGTALFTVAGAATIIVGLAAKTLITDVISGFIMLIENQFTIGDWIRVHTQTSRPKEIEGNVEEINVRRISVREINGSVVFIPNGQIESIQNFNRNPPVVRIPVPVSSAYPVDKARRAASKAISRFSSTPGVERYLRNPPWILGINLRDRGYELVVQADAVMGRQFTLRRMLNEVLVKAFEEEGIRPTVYSVEQAPGEKEKEEDIFKEVL